jgi:hypothetical protein
MACWSLKFLIELTNLSRSWLASFASAGNLLLTKVFGPQAVTFNAHSFYHLQVDRELNGPLWAHSTARFESMYGKARSCYDAKTANTPKQLFFWLMCRMRNQHACGTRRAVVINPKVTLKRDDSLIYDGRHFYKVKAKQGANLKCVRIRTAIITTKTIFQLPWSLVGVKLVTGYKSATEIVRLQDVQAKAVICNRVISTCYPEWHLI